MEVKTHEQAPNVWRAWVTTDRGGVLDRAEGSSELQAITRLSQLIHEKEYEYKRADVLANNAMVKLQEEKDRAGQQA